MGNSGKALWNPQRQPEHTENHRVSYPDRLPFSEFLQAVIGKHDTREYQVLAASYPSMITARNLLREAERLWAQARERCERQAENGVFNFVRVWLLSGKPKKKLKNIASMGIQEIEGLSQALCNLESENYVKLTLQSATCTLATWRDNPQVSLFLPFAEKVSGSWFLTPQHS